MVQIHLNSENLKTEDVTDNILDIDSFKFES